MVNTVVVSRYQGQPPAPNADRKIPGGPLYPREEVRQLLGAGSLTPWTRKCVEDLQKFVLDLEDVAEILMLALNDGDFRGSEWCTQQPKGPWAACDAYRVYREEWVAQAHKHLTFEYYIKFAIAKTGTILLIVSCHPSQSR